MYYDKMRDGVFARSFDVQEGMKNVLLKDNFYNTCVHNNV